jgi:hypothetical protein
MNPYMIASILIATVILLRILFLIAEIGEIGAIGNKIGNALLMEDLPPFTKKLLRGMPTTVVAYERFTQIHNQILIIASSGGHKYKFNLCYKDPEITKTIKVMVMEAFPDSALAHEKNGECFTYKISW